MFCNSYLLTRRAIFSKREIRNPLLEKIAITAFPPLRVGHASVQNSATATFLQGANLFDERKKKFKTNGRIPH
jgi:hypothetical protein